MYAIMLTEDSNNYLKKIRKLLKQHNYKYIKQASNLNTPYPNFTNEKIDIFIKNSIMFEIVRDLNTKEIYTYYYNKQQNITRKEILLAEIETMQFKD